MLSAYREVNNHNSAIKFFTDIISTYKLQPSADTYNVLIDLCAQKVSATISALILLNAYNRETSRRPSNSGSWWRSKACLSMKARFTRSPKSSSATAQSCTIPRLSCVHYLRRLSRTIYRRARYVSFIELTPVKSCFNIFLSQAFWNILLSARLKVSHILYAHLCRCDWLATTFC